MFRNILFTIVLLLGISLLAIPYVTGMGAEQQFSHFNQEVKLPSSMKWVNSQYTRGWFSSQAKSVLSWQTDTTQPAFITLAHEIKHGLLPIRPTQIHSQLHLDPTIYPPLIYSTENKDLLTANTIIQANGQGISQIIIPAFTIREDKIQWQWQGLLGTIAFHQDIFAQKLVALQTEIHISDFKFLIDIIQLSAKNIIFAAKIVDQALPSGKLTFSQLQYVANNLPITVKNLQLSSANNRLENNNLTVNLQSNVEQVQIDNKNYGPGQIDIEIRQLPANTLQAIATKVVSELQANFSEQQMQQTLFSTSLQHGLSLLNNKPELVVKQFTLNTAEGEIKAHFKLQLDKFPALALLKHSLLFNALEGEMAIELPRAFVYKSASQLLAQQNTTEQTVKLEQVDALVNIWIAKKLLIEKSDNYISHVVLKQGLLQINDQPFPLANLQ